MINLNVISNKDFEKLKKQKKFIIRYAYHETPFGKCLIGLHFNKICHLSFVVSGLESKNFKSLEKQWPGAELVLEKNGFNKIISQIFDDEDAEHKILMKGTPFQAQVWQALLKIEKGKTESYENVAKMVGNVKAVRAVASAVAGNYVGYLIPCHRVIKKDGSIHKYGWGPDLKKKLLQYEKYIV